MAETADSVVVELEAKLGNYQAQVNQGANAFEQSMTRMQGSASQTEKAVNHSFGSMRAGQMEFMHVIRGASDQFAAGTPLLQIFAQHIAQVAQAMSMMGSSGGAGGASSSLGELKETAGQASEAMDSVKETSEKLAGAFGKETAASRASSAATGTNTAARRGQSAAAAQSTVATEANTAAVAGNVVALEADAVAAGEAAVAHGGFAKFIGGPWGMAIIAGVAILGSLIAGHEKASDSADKHKDAETRLANALAAGKSATEAMEKAISDLRAAEDKSLETQDALIDRRYRLAEATLATARANKVALEGELAAAKARESAAAQRQGTSTGHGLEAASGEYAAAHGDVQRLQTSLDGLNKAIDDATATIADEAVQTARKMSSNVGRAEVAFDRQQRALEIKYRGGNTDAGHVDGLFKGATPEQRRGLVAELAREEDKLRIAREAAITAARKLDDAETGKGHNTAAAAEAAATSVAYMVKTLKELIPGAIVTSTTGGKHVAGSDHYKDRAIDFVPAGGMGSMTKDQVREILEGAGIRIRRNANGVEQLFGPGDKGHSDHFHFAWEGGGPSADTIARRLAAEADKSAARQQEANAQIARSNDALIGARRALANTAEEQAALARQDVEADRKAFEDNITAQHNRKKLTDTEFATLKGLNDQRAKARLDLVDQQQAERTRREAQQQAQRDTAMATGALDAQEEVLRSQAALADTVAERRDIELKLLDLQFQEEAIRLKAIIAESDRLNAIQDASEQEKQAAREAAAAAAVARQRLATLPVRQANAAESVSRQNEGPMAAYRRQLMSATSDMGLALQSVEVHAFQGLEDGLTSTIAKVLKLKGAFGQMAASIIADLARIEIERAILGATGKSGGLFGTIANLLGSAASVTSGTTGDFNGIPLQTFNFGGGRAGGGPVVAGTLYRVNEQRMEGFRPAGSGTIVPLGDMPSLSAPGGVTVVQPLHLHLEGAVMTADLMAQMNALADQAAMRGAVGGSALARQELARAQARRLA